MGTLPPRLSTIPDDAVDLRFPAPQYSNDFAQIVGNAASDSDGWDSLIQPISDFTADFPNFLSGLDVALALVDFNFPAVNTPWEQDFADTLTGAISQGQPDFDKYNVALTQNTPPAAGTPPGGTAPPTKANSSCEQILTFPNFTISVQTVHLTATFKNTLTVPMQIQKLVLYYDVPGVISYVSHLPAVLQPGQSGTIDFSATIQPKATPYASLGIFTNDPNSPHYICLILQVNPPSAGGTPCYPTVNKTLPPPQCGPTA